MAAAATRRQEAIKARVSLQARLATTHTCTLDLTRLTSLSSYFHLNPNPPVVLSPTLAHLQQTPNQARLSPKHGATLSFYKSSNGAAVLVARLTLKEGIEATVETKLQLLS